MVMKAGSKMKRENKKNKTSHFLAGSAILLMIALSNLACFSGFYQMEPVRHGNNLALFTLEADDYPDSPEVRAQLGAIQKMPELTPEQIEVLLGNLRYTYKSIWGDNERNVFYPDELKDLAPAISDAIKKIAANQRLLIISRYDPDKSVLSRMERVTAMLWADSRGVNLVLGEIRQEIPHNDFLEYDEWTEVLPVSLKQSYPYYSIVPSKDYSLRKIGGFTHGTWVVFDNARIAALNKKHYYSYRQKIEILTQAKNNNLLTKEEANKKLERVEFYRKKKILDQALAAGLISPAEYDAKFAKLKKPLDYNPESDSTDKPEKDSSDESYMPSDEDKKEDKKEDEKEDEKKSDEEADSNRIRDDKDRSGTGEESRDDSEG